MIVKRTLMIVDISEGIECFLVSRSEKIDERNDHGIAEKRPRFDREAMREVLQFWT